MARLSRDALDQLIPRVYQELRGTASRHLARDWPTTVLYSQRSYETREVVLTEPSADQP